MSVIKSAGLDSLVEKMKSVEVRTALDHIYVVAVEYALKQESNNLILIQKISDRYKIELERLQWKERDIKEIIDHLVPVWDRFSTSVAFASKSKNLSKEDSIRLIEMAGIVEQFHNLLEKLGSGEKR